MKRSECSKNLSSCLSPFNNVRIRSSQHNPVHINEIQKRCFSQNSKWTTRVECQRSSILRDFQPVSSTVTTASERTVDMKKSFEVARW
ncbi:hypothetical protein BD410DRAFT_102240 [Rickenella mellea]|uniref:Uncharacterized protein n=1 Tax=Rickenella mellea TaxID=50990 RepID=A0A4Y7PKJ3_9AGAM|nr:hypothetical protein BD410DRAFT_102240 [Rickenella mellea]